MKKKTKKRINLIITYVIITFIGVLMLYPILWMFFARV